MPEPLTPSDEASLAKLAAVIDFAQRELAQRVFLVLCPNVVAKDEEARRHTFEQRPFFRTDARIDPGDPAALAKMVAWRERLLRPLARADGVFIIDSDPGGYPHSTNTDFVYLLGAHRRMLDRLRPGIELVYWTHFGWESYCRFYATGELKRGQGEEPRETIALIARQRFEPWSVASSGFPADLADAIGQSDRMLGFPYHGIEREPSFPFTLFGEQAYKAGQRGGARGVLGNAQTHVVQLPNTFAFARAARGLSVDRADYVHFAGDLVPGGGGLIVEGWEALQGEDPARHADAARQLEAFRAKSPGGGPLQGLLLGGPDRFLEDLVLQLRAVGALHAFRAAQGAEPAHPARTRETFVAFVAAIATWQQRHGFSGHWRWPAMQEALRKFDAPGVHTVLDTLKIVSDEGATPFERVKNGLADLETYTTRLIAAMQRAVSATKTQQ
jgi:hypothetical protein